MKNNFLLYLLLICSFVLIISCDNTDEKDSVAAPIVLPIISEKRMQDAYVYGQGQATLQADLPDTVAIALDTVYGFEGGYGGKTGADNYAMLKSEILGGFPDLTDIGGYSIAFEKFNKGGYKVTTSSSVVIAGPIPDPGPTDLEGTFARTTNGYLLQVKKVFPGVFIIGNPGGAASVPFNPYLLYNHDNGSGGDALRFPIQTDLCGGGLRLVSPSATGGKTAAEYDAFPPIISNYSPLTLQWKVYEFPSASRTAVHPDAALCNWGHTAVRTFVKQ